MLIWIVFLIIEYALLFFYEKETDSKKKVYIVSCFALIAVYFAGFRDCLGMDYDGYRDWCERDRYLNYDIWLFSEPLLELIRSFCANTEFSAVVFFVVMAALTSLPAVFVYSKYKNFALAAFIYLTYTGLYLFSFNIVRQFAAGGLCLLASYYLLKEKCLYNTLIFVGLVILASLIHKSSLLFLFVYFISGKDYNINVIVAIIIASFIIPIGSIPGVSFITDIIDAMDYTIYMDYNSHSVSKTSLSNLYMHIMIIPFLMNKNKLLKLEGAHNYVFALKMFVIFLVCNNLSANGMPIAYRIGIFFVMFVPIILSALPRLINRQMAYFLIIPPLVFLFFFIGLGNPLVVPDILLPLNSIFDSVYNHYF